MNLSNHSTGILIGIMLTVSVMCILYALRLVIRMKKTRPHMSIMDHINESITGNRPVYDPFNDDEKIMKGENETYFE